MYEIRADGEIVAQSDHLSLIRSKIAELEGAETTEQHAARERQKYVQRSIDRFVDCYQQVIRAHEAGGDTRAAKRAARAAENHLVATFDRDELLQDERMQRLADHHSSR